MVEAAKLDSVMKKIHQDLASASMGDLNNVKANFRNLVAMSQDYTTQAVKSKSATQQWTESLVKQDIHLGQLRKSGKMFNDVLREQYQLQKMSAVQWTKNASGVISADIIVPKGTSKIVNELTGSLSENVRVLSQGKAAGAAYSEAIKVMQMRMGMANQVLGSVADNMVKWGKNTQWAGRQLTVGLMVPLAALGAYSGSLALKVNEQMTRILKVYDFTTKGAAQVAESQQLHNDSMQMGTQVARLYGKALEETLSVEADLAATGLQGQELIRSTAQVQRAATLGEMDYQSTIKATIAMQSIYGQSWKATGGIAKNTADAFNYMNSIENATSLSMQDFVEAIPRAAGPLHELGGTIQDLGVLLTAMKAAGVDSTVGANALKSSLGSLIEPSTKALKVIDNLTRGTGHFVDLQAIVQRNGGNYVKTMEEFSAGLEQAFSGMSDEQRNLNIQRIVETLFGKQQYARIGGIINQLGNLHDQTTQVGRAFAVNEAGITSWANTAAGELQKIRTSASGQFHIAIQTIRAQLATVGEDFLKVGTGFLHVITWIINAFSKMPSALKKGLLLGVIVMAAAGPLIMLTGLIANLIGQGLKMVHWVLNLGDAFTAMTAEERAAQMLGEQHSVAWRNQANSAQALAGSIAMLTSEFQTLAQAQQLSNAANGVLTPAQAAAARGPLKYSATSPTGYRQGGKIASYSDVAAMPPIVASETGFRQGGKFASQAQFDAYNKALEKAGIQTEKLGRNWSAIGGHMQKMAIGVGILGSMVSSGNQLLSTITNVVFVAGLLGPTLVKGIRAAGITAALSKLFAAGSMAKIISPLRSAITSSIALLARFAGPIALVGAAAVFTYMKIHGAMKQARKEQDDISNSAKNWGDVLGFVYENTKKIATASGGSKDSLQVMASAFADANKATAKQLATLGQLDDKQQAINAAIQEGVKARLHGADATQAQQVVQVALRVAGFKSDDILDIVKDQVSKIDWSNMDDVLNTSLKGFASEWNKVLQNKMAEESNWESIWRLATGNKGLDASAKEAAKNIGESFWNAWQQESDPQKRLTFFRDFSTTFDKQQNIAFNELSEKTKNKMKKFGITNMNELMQTYNDYQHMDFSQLTQKYGSNAQSLIETFDALGDDEGAIKRAAQAQETLARSIARANGATDKQIDGVHSLTDLYGILDMPTKTVTEAQNAYNKVVGEGDGAWQHYSDAQKLATLNMYRHQAGLPDATSLQQGFAGAVNDTTAALIANAQAAGNMIEINKSNIGDLTKNAMSGAQSAVTSQAGNIWSSWASAQVDAIKTSNADLDRADKAAEKRIKAQQKASDTYYNNRIKKIQAQLNAEKRADEQRQRMFDAEMTRLQRLAEMMNSQIDFNVALNTGSLDEAAKIRNTMQATQDTNTLNDANAGAGDAAKRREDALQAQIDALKAQKDAHHNALQKQLDAEKAANDKRRQLRDKDTANAKDSLQKQLANRKLYLDMEVAAITANVPRTKKEYDAQITQIEGAYKKYGLDLKGYGADWGKFVGTALSENVQTAANSMKNDINWQNIANTVGKQFAEGAFGLTLDQWATWINTGKLPKGGIHPKTKDATSGGGGGGRTSMFRASHGGGIIGDPKRQNLLGRDPKSDLWDDEILVRAQKGEYMINKKAHQAIGTEFLDMLNDGMLFRHAGGPIGPSGLAMSNLVAMLIGITGGTMGAASAQALGADTKDINPFQGIDYTQLKAAKPGVYANMRLDGNQLANAAAIMGVGRAMHASTRDLIVSIMTAMQESGLRNINYGDRDSLGLFQQRPSQGWGTPEEILNPQYAAMKFFRGLLSIKNRDSMPLTLEAQAVQRSAYPGAYAKWEPEARSIVMATLPKLLTGGTIKYDNTIANLHRDEKVLTAPLSKSLEKGINNLENGGSTYEMTFDFRGATIDKDVDIERAVENAINKIETRKGRSRKVGG